MFLCYVTCSLNLFHSILVKILPVLKLILLNKMKHLTCSFTEPDRFKDSKFDFDNVFYPKVIILEYLEFLKFSEII